MREFTGSTNHDTLILEILGRLAAVDEAAEKTSCGYGPCALDVVVEDAHRLAVRRCAHVVAVVLKNVHGNIRAEILKLYKDVGKSHADRVEELVDKLKVGVAAQPVLYQSNVVGVVEESLVVRANIQAHRQNTMWRDPACCTVQSQLPDGNAHAIRPEVAESQDAGPIGDDDHLHFAVRPVCHARVHLAAVESTDVHATGPAEANAKLLARQAHRGRVNDWRKVLDVFDKQRVKQGLVVVADVSLRVRVCGWVTKMLVRVSWLLPNAYVCVFLSASIYLQYVYTCAYARTYITCVCVRFCPRVLHS